MSKKGGSKPGAVAAVKIADIKPPAFWDERVQLFDKYYSRQQASYESIKQAVQVTLPDGKKMDAESWITTPMEIAKRISKQLPDKVIVAKVNGELWDLHRPIEGDCSLELLDWDEPEARKVFWHSSAHVLGYAMERLYACELSYGPPLDDGGFFYEGLTDRSVSEGDYAPLKDAMSELVKTKSPYLRLVLGKEETLAMFGYNKFKQITLGQKVPDGGTCTIYRCGNMIDPCRGPHIPDTGRVKAFAVTKNSSAYFQSDSSKESLQRVYAIAFPKEAQLKEHLLIVAEAAKRDHRVIGRQQNLFHFDEISPGSAFWTPMGARIYNSLMDFQKKQYRKRGFEEVISPNMFNSELWKTSGHWDLYADAMFKTTCEHETFGLKPMNCPGHCMMYAHRPHSYKDLPIRWADFGALHRNELSGALSGLTRVRRFCQDDAHIFCRLDQVTTEIKSAVEFVKAVYDVLGFKFFLKLSTMPEKALGDVETWREAEGRLQDALNQFCNIPSKVNDPFKEGSEFVFDGTVPSLKKLKAAAVKAAKSEDESSWKGPTFEPWELNAGDGAFYGPKIDIVVEDALKRRHQCATIQLDFQLPDRFGLKYTLRTEKKADEVVEGSAAEKKPEAEEKKVEEKKHVDPEAKAEVAEKKPEAEVVAEKKDGEVAKVEKKEEKMQHIHIDKTLGPNEARPVMIHRAIFGSLERCIAILCEHYGGKWPFWMSPRQCVIIPVALTFEDYAKEVQQEIYGEGFHCEVDSSPATFEKKIRNAQISQWNLILVVGEKELETKTVAIRTRDSKQQGSKSIEETVQWMTMLQKTYSREF